MVNPKYAKVVHAPGLSKWECKKGKGEHKFVFVEEHNLFGWNWLEYKCANCGKRKRG